MRDAVTEINIENPVAREAFIRWWRTMEAQGYQYGFEALCNVWVGFDDGRADLARKVIETVESERDYNQTAQDYSRRNVTYERAISDVLTALRELLQKEGVNVADNETDRRRIQSLTLPR